MDQGGAFDLGGVFKIDREIKLHQNFQAKVVIIKNGENVKTSFLKCFDEYKLSLIAKWNVSSQDILIKLNLSKS